MSDKTKKVADDRLWRARMEREAKPPAPPLLCACGAFANFALHTPRRPVALYCDACAHAAGLIT